MIDFPGLIAFAVWYPNSKFTSDFRFHPYTHKLNQEQFSVLMTFHPIFIAPNKFFKPNCPEKLTLEHAQAWKDVFKKIFEEYFGVFKEEDGLKTYTGASHQGQSRFCGFSYTRSSKQWNIGWPVMF